MGKRYVIISIIVITLVSFKLIDSSDTDKKSSINAEATTGGYDPIVVLELFTSQGCSSCPAADRLLNEVKSNYPELVVTLSYHVDYWDYIGWKDPFSSNENTIKQSVYNRKLGYKGNYTPEIVVNGKSHFTGSNKTKMTSAIQRFGKERTPNKITILKNTQKNGSIGFSYAVDGNLNNKNVRALLVLDQRATEVKRGENRNRTIKNSNIVVAETKYPLDGLNAEGTIKVPNLVSASDTLSLIILLENEQHDIVAAAKETVEKS